MSPVDDRNDAWQMKFAMQFQVKAAPTLTRKEGLR
jgi:hypothetical protein